MRRGYDTPDLYREDALLRIRHLYTDISDIRMEIKKIEESMPQVEEDDEECE